MSLSATPVHVCLALCLSVGWLACKATVHSGAGVRQPEVGSEPDVAHERGVSVERDDSAAPEVGGDPSAARKPDEGGMPPSKTRGNMQGRCASAPERDPVALYSLCLACGREALRANQPSKAEACLDRAIECGHPEGVVEVRGRLIAFEQRGDARAAQADYKNALVDYRRAIHASRMRDLSMTTEYAALLEKTGNTAEALGLHGEAFASFSAALKVVGYLHGDGGHAWQRVHRRVQKAAQRLHY